MPNDIKCVGNTKYGVDLSEKVEFLYDNFKVSHSFTVKSLINETYQIRGDEGVIHVPLFHFAKKASIKGKITETIKDDSLLYLKQFNNVAKEIEDGLLTSNLVTKENTINCMELMDTCRKQMNVIFPYEKEN